MISTTSDGVVLSQILACSRWRGPSRTAIQLVGFTKGIICAHREVLTRRDLGALIRLVWAERCRAAGHVAFRSCLFSVQNVTFSISRVEDYKGCDKNQYIPRSFSWRGRGRRGGVSNPRIVRVRKGEWAHISPQMLRRTVLSPGRIQFCRFMAVYADDLMGNVLSNQRVWNTLPRI